MGKYRFYLKKTCMVGKKDSFTADRSLLGFGAKAAALQVDLNDSLRERGDLNLVRRGRKGRKRRRLLTLELQRNR